jgi:hypothetical protein
MSNMEDEMDQLMEFKRRTETHMQNNLTEHANTRQSLVTINDTLTALTARLEVLQPGDQVNPAPVAAPGARANEAGGGGGGPDAEERARRDMRRSLSFIPKFSGEKTGITFRQHVDAMRTHISVYEISDKKIAKSGLLMSLTGSAYTRASGVGIGSATFNNAEGFEEYASELLAIFEPDSEKQLARSDFVHYKQAAMEDIGTYIAVKSDLWRQAYPGTQLDGDESAYQSYAREVVRGIYSRVIKRLVVREKPRTAEQLKTACLEAVSAERANYELGCSESGNLDGLASVTRGYQRRREDEAMEVNAMRPGKDRDMVCHHCHKKGHRMSECRTRQRQLDKPQKQTEKGRGAGGRDKPKETRTCRSCSKVGHLERDCWAKHGKPKKGAVNSASTQEEEEVAEEDWNFYDEEEVNELHETPFLAREGRRSRE